MLIRNLSCPPTPAVYFAAGTSGQPCALVGPQPGDLNDQQEKSFQSSQAWGMGGGRGDRPARVPVPPRPDGVGRTGRGARERTWRGRVGRPSPGQLQSPSVSLAMGTALQGQPWFLAPGHAGFTSLATRSSFPEFPELWQQDPEVCPPFCWPHWPVEEGGMQPSGAGSPEGLSSNLRTGPAPPLPPPPTAAQAAKGLPLETC